MKFLLKPTLLLLLACGLHSVPSQAQVQVQVNVGAPAWGPPVGAGAQYYYIPEIDGYYDLYNQMYVYFDPYYNSWVSTPALPAYYAGYDPRFFHPVVVQYVGRQPWGYIYDHRAYCNTRGWRPGYYRSAPGPRGAGYYNVPPGYRAQANRYDNRPYAQNGNYGGRDNYNGGRDGHDGYNNRGGNDQPGYGNGPRQRESRGQDYGGGRGNSQGQQGQQGQHQSGHSQGGGPGGGGRGSRVR